MEKIAYLRDTIQKRGALRGPITKETTGFETYGVVFACPRAQDINTIWAGSERPAWSTDAQRRPNGPVTQKDLPDSAHSWTKRRRTPMHRYSRPIAIMDVMNPTSKTADVGKTWTNIVNG